MRYGMYILATAPFAQANGKAFQILTTTGFKIILPPAYLHEVRNNPDLTFIGFIQNVRPSPDSMLNRWRVTDNFAGFLWTPSWIRSF